MIQLKRFHLFLFSIVTVLLFQLYLLRTDLTFGEINFFYKRGFLFLFFITLFPRLTLLFSSVASGGVLWWIGFVFYPRLLIAGLATISYIKTNPVLVGISWFVALTGEIIEKRTFQRPFISQRSFVFHRPFVFRRGRRSQRNSNTNSHNNSNYHHHNSSRNSHKNSNIHSRDDIVDVDYKRMD